MTRETRHGTRLVISSTVREMQAGTELLGLEPKDGIPSLFKEWSDFLGSDNKGIIYVLSKSDADSLSNSLKIPSYYASHKYKERNLTAWLDGTHQWIVATCGLGAGIDVPNIKLVINYGMPTDILEWVQMAGRGGREIERAWCLVVEPRQSAASKRKHYQSAKEIYPERHEVTLTILSGRTCVRQVLASYMDGIDVGNSCGELSAETCWVCSTSDINVRPNLTTSGRFDNPTTHVQGLLNPLQLVRQNEGELIDFGCFILRRMSESCVFCLLLSDLPYDVDGHAVAGCLKWTHLNVSQERLWNRTSGWRNHIRLQPGTCCYRCICPRSICQEGTDRGEASKCTFKMIMWYVVFAACHSEKWKRLMPEISISGNQSVISFGRSLTRPVMWGGAQCNLMILLVERIGRQIGLWEEFKRTF